MNAPRRTRQAMQRPQFRLGLPPLGRPALGLAHDSVTAASSRSSADRGRSAAATSSPLVSSACGLDTLTVSNDCDDSPTPPRAGSDPSQRPAIGAFGLICRLVLGGGVWPAG